MLTMDPVVSINVDISSGSQLSRDFDVGAIITSSSGSVNPLTKTSRYAEYSSAADVLTGVGDLYPAYANGSAVYAAAEKYFGVSPSPAKLVVIYYDAASEETPATAMLDAIEKGADFYGVVWLNPDYADTEHESDFYTTALAIASVLDSLKKGMFFYGIVGNLSTVLDANKFPQKFFTSGIKRALGVASNATYSTVTGGENNDAAAVMGTAMGLARTHTDRAFALCYKPCASAIAATYGQAEINNIKEINGNVVVSRARNRAGIENGATASGLRFDEVFFVDRIVYELQNSIYAMIADNPDKLPQTDSTTQLFKAEIFRILERYYAAGVLATAPWRGRPIGTIDTGDILEHGYTAFADSFDNQSDSDRAQHKAMPITILACLSGSVESIVINLSVRT